MFDGVVISCINKKCHAKHQTFSLNTVLAFSQIFHPNCNCLIFLYFSTGNYFDRDSCDV
jgi:hypothetical protein